MKNVSFWNYGEYSSDNYGAHTLAFCDGKINYYFSYQTLVAFSFNGVLYVRENVWGTTAGKHLNWIDGGTKEAKKQRLSKEAFEDKLSKAQKEAL